MTENILKTIVDKQTEFLIEAKSIDKVKGVLVICDIEGEGYITSGLGTTTNAKTAKMMRDDAACMICSKHCCAEPPLSDECCEACPLYEFIRYQEGI